MKSTLTAPVWCKDFEIKTEPSLCWSLQDHYKKHQNNNLDCGCCDGNTDLTVFKQRIYKHKEEFDAYVEASDIGRNNEYVLHHNIMYYSVLELLTRLENK